MPNLRNDTWRFIIKSDVEGDEPQTIVLKGTRSPITARAHAELIAGAMRQRVAREWGEEYAPTLTVEGPEAAGDNSNTPAGQYRPRNAKPIDLDKFVKLAAERIGQPVVDTAKQRGAEQHKSRAQQAAHSAQQGTNKGK